jgi:hypothetical protein
MQDSALFTYRAQDWRQTQALIDGLQAAHFGRAHIALYVPFAQRESPFSSTPHPQRQAQRHPIRCAVGYKPVRHNCHAARRPNP